MKIPKIAEAMAYIDEDLLVAADAPKKKKSAFAPWGAVAACVCLAALCAIPLVRMSDRPHGEGETADGTRPYRTASIIVGETEVVFPWEYKTVYERYGTLEVDGVTFRGLQRSIPASAVGDGIGLYEATGYDETDGDGIYRQSFEVHEINGVSPRRLVAVSMEGAFYVFAAERWDPPATWGGVLSEYGLPEAVVLSRYSTSFVGEEKAYFALREDGYLWDILRSCEDALLADSAGWHEIKRNYISFTVTSEVLGVYKQVLYITEDGYLWTNMFYGEYLYYIGEAAAAQIMAYAADNGEAAAFEPYRGEIAGVITEVTDRYFLVDDTLLCENPSDGLVFKVLLGDARISRYGEMGMLRTGDLVQVVYEGAYDEENVIAHAVSVAGATLSDGEIMIPE